MSLPEPQTTALKLLKANLTVTQVRYTLINFLLLNLLITFFFTASLMSMRFLSRLNVYKVLVYLLEIRILQSKSSTNVRSLKYTHYIALNWIHQNIVLVLMLLIHAFSKKGFSTIKMIFLHCT